MSPDIYRHTLGDLLRRTSARFPDKLAIRCGSVDWTYAEFDAVCSRLAAGLHAQGVRSGDRVAHAERPHADRARALMLDLTRAVTRPDR